VDRDERDEQNLMVRRNVAAAAAACSLTSLDGAASSGLLFHPNCGSHASVINGTKRVDT